MPASSLDPALERREQILRAAMICFAKRGFHQTSMHDISAEAGISVGLIYRYFENKDAVISAMADEHKREIHEVLERARLAPSLLEALEIIFTCALLRKRAASACPLSWSIFSRRLDAIRGSPIWCATLSQTAMDGVTDLIARSPEAPVSCP